MTKSDSSYAIIDTAEPFVEGFAIGPVTVIVDETTPSPATGPPKAPNGMDRSAKTYAPESTNASLGGSRKPLQLSMCPQCSQTHIRTSTKTYPSAVTWASVVVSAVICFPLFWIPLVVDSMKQTDHYCQNCGKKVGTVKALEGCFVKERV